MKLPDGVVGLRKVKTRLGGEDGRTHLTWVLAYNAGIAVGSPHYEAIRTFAGGLKPPRSAGKPMEQSVMFLPVAASGAAPDVSHAPEPAARAPRKPAKKRRTRPAPKPAAKRTAKAAAKRTSKTTKPTRSRPRRPRRAQRARRR